MSIYAFVAIIVIVVVLSFFNEKVTKLPNEIALMLFSTVRLLICDSRVFCSVLLTAFDLYAYPLSARIRSSVNGNARKHRDGSA